MESTESDLLVAIPSSNYYEDVDPSINAHIYDSGDLNVSLVCETRHSSLVEYEGNVNCAMDLFAPDYGSHSSKNSEHSTSGRQSCANICDVTDKTMSDCDGTASEKAESNSNYVSFINEHVHMDSVSLSSDVNEAGCDIFCPKNLSTPAHFITDRVACTSPHFPSSNITFPSSAQGYSPSTTPWSTFGENKENTIPSSPYKSKYTPTRPPPAIPERKSLRSARVARSSPIQQHPSSTSSPTADLLSMDMVDLQNHLSDATSSPINSRSLAKPVIPPRKTLFSTSSTSGKLQFSDEKVDMISSSLPEGHINQAHTSNDSFPLPIPITTHATKGPPVPPRKNAPQIEINVITALATTSSSGNSHSHSHSFSLQNTDSISEFGLCPWVNFMDSNTNTGTVNETSSNILDTETGTSLFNKDSNADELNCYAEEDPHWSKRLSPDTRSTVKKKGTGGIGYLSLENDDCDTIGSINDIDSLNSAKDGVVMSLPTNDLSPEKPQSHWATFHNEVDDEEKADASIDNMSCGAVSLPSGALNSSGSGFAGSFVDADVADLEDDFAINPNRLSVEIPNLKGFNRADKGSQNNLVDFSDDRGSVAVSVGSHDGDEDVETIFDLTAQGDSLKRKRPRGSITVVTNFNGNVTDGSIGSSNLINSHSDPNANVSFHVGPAGLDDYVFADECNSFHTQTKCDPMKTETDHHSSCSSRAETPAICPVESSCDARQSMSSNPFWSPSARTAPSTGSQSSSADTPFDMFVFSASKTSICHDKSKPTTPIRIKPVSTPSTPVPLIRIPPPPLSQSKSSNRHMRSSHAAGRTRHISHDSRKRLELDSASDFSQSVSTLPSSRAETPTLAPIVNNVANETGATTSPIIFADNVSEPLNIVAWQDSATQDSDNKDLFTWLDESQRDGCLTEQGISFHKLNTETNNANDALPSDQYPATTSTLVQKNCNMNANVAKPDNFVFDLNNTVESKRKEAEDEKPPAKLISDSSRKPNDALSIKNMDAKTAEYTSILPEIDLVQLRTSWDVFMRFPMTKRTMSNRKWVPIHIKLFNDPVDHPQVKLYYTAKVVDPFHTLSLASHQMQMSKPALQQHFSEDGQILGKLHTVKLNTVQYKEKQTFTRHKSLTRNASGFKHAYKGKQTVKLGFSVHHEVMSFVKAIGDSMFYAHKQSPKANSDEHVPTVKYHSRNEILVDVVDEVEALVDESGVLKACKVRVHFFVGSFLSGDPMAKININDQKVEGKEVVPRGDIIPSSLDGWIVVRDPELHESCTSDSLEGDNAGTCVCYPPDACRFELMRFKTNYTEPELPLKVKASVNVKCAQLQLRCNIMLNDKIKDGLGQLVCEDIMVRFPVPDDWCAYFKVEGKLKKQSVRAKRSAKSNIKTPATTGVAMEASIGFAKYEKAYQAIVWRIPRLPDKGALPKPHVFSCRIELVSDRELNKLQKVDENGKAGGTPIPPQLDERFKFCEVEYSMIGPVASKVSVRSVSMPNTDGGERFISYSSNFFYKVGVDVSVERISDDDEVDPADLCMTQ